MKKVVLAIVAIALIVVLTWIGIHNRYGQNGTEGFGRNFGPPNVTVITATVEAIPVEEVLPGRTTAHRIAEIRPQVGGIIEARLFEEGSDVEQGQHLYRLEQSRYETALQSANANLAQAKASEYVADLKARRYQKLIGSKSISQQDYDDAMAQLTQANANVKVAEAAVSTAKLNLSYTEVYAPISGRIGKSFVTEGALVTANQTQPLAVITQLDPMYVDIQQSSADNLRLRDELRDHDKVLVTLRVQDQQIPYRHQGLLKFSDVSVDESTGAVDVRALFPNPDHRLLPGMFVTATLHLGMEKSIAVPQQAVSRNLQGDAFVWVVSKDDEVHQQVVTTERAYKDKWVISKGLNAGDMLVTEGVQRLEPGIKVIPHGPEPGK